jgi:hypothetical protein
MQFTEREFLFFLREMMAKTRQLIHKQLRWFASEKVFQWVLSEPSPLGLTEHIEDEVMRLYNMSSEEFDAYVSRPEWVQQQEKAKVVSKEDLKTLRRYQPNFKIFWTIRRTKNPHIAKQLDNLRNLGPRLRLVREILAAKRQLRGSVHTNGQDEEEDDV